MRNHLVKSCSGNHGGTWRTVPTYKTKVIRKVMDSGYQDQDMLLTVKWVEIGLFK